MGKQSQEKEMRNEEQLGNGQPYPTCHLEGVPEFKPQIAISNDVEVTDRERYCGLCQLQFATDLLKKCHEQQKIHRVNKLKAWLNVAKDKCEEDKCGVRVSCLDISVLSDNSFPIQTYIKKPRSITIRVENHSKCNVLIMNADFLIDTDVAVIYDDVGLNSNSTEAGLGVTKVPPYKRVARLLPDSPPYKFRVTCQSSEAGVYYIPIAFDFALEGKSTSFQIIRFLTIQFSTSLIEELENLPATRKPTRKIRLPKDVAIIKGKDIPREPELYRLHTEIELEKYEPSDLLRSICKLRSWEEEDLQKCRHITDPQAQLIGDIKKMFDDGLGRSNYREYLHTLLHIEELEMEKDIEMFNVEDGRLEVENQLKNFYKLEVPGLRENRPSLLRGDRVLVGRLYDGVLVDNELYEGIVHRVEDITVVLGFNERFSDIYVKNMQFFIKFTFSRMPLRLMHQAISSVKGNHFSILFPTNRPYPTYSHDACISNIKPFNRAIGINDEQKQVILQILNGGSRPAPYLLFGPSGTGKTMTLVEAIKQVDHLIWDLDSSSFILVCAPSNSACDTVTERLLDHIPSSHLLRLFAASRDISKISDKIMKSCNYNKSEQQFFFPSKDELKKYRILVMTLICSGRLVQAAFSNRHFTHIFIDEAGQSIEPELLIPITGLINSQQTGKDLGGTLVLAGDPRQLGPILRSKITAGRVSYIKDSLATSLLERLMNKCDLYQRHERNGGNHFNRRYLTKLLRNYRSHNAILTMPNQMFYDGELIACADKVVVNSLCNWEHLPAKKFPIIFHGVMGREKKESHSPSFYNPEEVCMVMNYVNNLLEENKVQSREIGIISPYRKQVEKIKWSLQKYRRNDITVGSTEEFQGQERRVIIISTVRSNRKVLASDFEFKLGFLKSEKRFNVAVTRAKALLVIIGNPYILSKDQQWGEFLNYCIDHRAYIGCKFSKSEDAIEDIYERFERLNCIPDGFDSMELSVGSQVEMEEGPQWPLVTE